MFSVFAFYSFAQIMSEPVFAWTDNSLNCFSGLETKRLAAKSSHTWLAIFILQGSCKKPKLQSRHIALRPPTRDAGYWVDDF